MCAAFVLTFVLVAVLFVFLPNRLSINDIEYEVIEAVPPGDVQLVADQIPVVYLGKLLSALAFKLEASPHLGTNVNLNAPVARC